MTLYPPEWVTDNMDVIAEGFLSNFKINSNKYFSVCAICLRTQTYSPLDSIKSFSVFAICLLEVGPSLG